MWKMNKWKLGKKKFLGISLWEAWMGHFLFSSIPRNQMGFFLGHHELEWESYFERMWTKNVAPQSEGNIGAIPSFCKCECLYTWTTPRAVLHCRRRSQCLYIHTTALVTGATLVEQSNSVFAELGCNLHCSTRLPELRWISLLHMEAPQCFVC